MGKTQITEYEKWTEETKKLIEYLVSIELKNNEEYQIASNKRKHEIKEETWKKIYIRMYPDTRLGIEIRKELCEPPQGLSGETIEIEGYTIYFSNITAMEQSIRIINDKNGKLGINEIETGTILKEYESSVEGWNFTCYIYIWINHDDKIALISSGYPSIEELRSLINKRFPMKLEIFAILNNWLPYVNKFSDRDIRNMASEFFPGMENECVVIARKGYEGYLKEIKENDEFEKHKSTYHPNGKRVRVKDMKPGYLYTFEDMSLEVYIKYVKKLDVGNRDAYGYKAIYNAGLMKKPFWTNPKTGKVRVWLFYVGQRAEPSMIPTKTINGGKSTGNYIWSNGRDDLYRYDIERFMDPDDYVVEAYPFPVGIYREGYEMEWIPNPDKWVRVYNDAPHTKFEDHVSVWDETDFSILIILALVSLLMVCGGVEGITLACGMWLFATIGFYVNHKRIKEEVLKERNKRNIRGNGMDHHFK